MKQNICDKTGGTICEKTAKKRGFRAQIFTKFHILQKITGKSKEIPQNGIYLLTKNVPYSKSSKFFILNFFLV